MRRKKTLRLTVEVAALDSQSSTDALSRAAEILKQGGTVAFATETVYGLGANALDEEAVRQIFIAKQRPAWDPLIVHVADAGQLALAVREIPQSARALMAAFWPGPLTLLMAKSDRIPDLVTAARPKAGVRMPAHPVARRLIEMAGVPIAAPSANSFGRTSPTRAQFVLEDLDGRIDAIVDSGDTSFGLESTVIDPGEDPPVLYRPGVVTLEQLQAVCGPLQIYQPPERGGIAPSSLPSPGAASKHYAPHAKLVLFALTPAGAIEAGRLAARWRAAGEKPAIMLPDTAEAFGLEQIGIVYRWGSWLDLEELARRLFAGLRELDAAGATVILCPLPAEQGVGAAIRDRLLKAAAS